MIHAEWLPILMQGSFSEIYVFDAQSLRFMQTNPAARRNLRYSAAELAAMTPLDLAHGLTHTALTQLLQSLQLGDTGPVLLDTTHTRKDGTAYPIEFRLFLCAGNPACYIAIGNDTSQRDAHVQTAKEQERTRIAREIHDDVGGNLTAIKMALALLKKRLPAESGLHDQAAYLDELVDRTIDAAHRISVDLRPGILDAGIVAAIEWQARECEKQYGIACRIVTNRKVIALGPDQTIALFRIFQEAMTNIGKHANASRVEVRLSAGRHDVRLLVRDDGCGITQADRSKSRSFGLRGMAERARAVGGELTVGRAAGGGTEVALKIPLADPAPDQEKAAP